VVRVAGADIGQDRGMQLSAATSGTPGRPVTVVSVRGDVDLDGAPALRAALHNLLGLLQPRIVIDLSGVDFCDSTGLSAFVYAYTHCRDHGGFLHLAAPTPFLTGILAVVGIAGHVPIFNTVADAVRG
jgi:anti-sigma B factor antagonist